MTSHATVTLPVTPADFPEVRWRGHWIWTEGPPPERGFAGMGAPPPPPAEAHGLFRKTIELAVVPARVPTRITADSRYILYVNGTEVFRGPARSQPRRTQYDLFDIAPYLRIGSNVIAVHVKYYGTAKSYWMPAPSGSVNRHTGIMVFEANLGDAWVVSDATWKALKSDAWMMLRHGEGPIAGGVPAEFLDARKYPLDWEQSSFDDGAWGSAALIPQRGIGSFARTQPPASPYGPLYPRNIARLSGGTFTPTGIQVDYLLAPLDLTNDVPAGRVNASALLTPSSSASVASLPVRLEGAARWRSATDAGYGAHSQRLGEF